MTAAYAGIWLLILMSPVLNAGVRISGLHTPLKDNVQLFLSVAALPADADPAAVRRALKRTPEEVRSALQPFGYYSPTINPRFVSAKGDTPWQVELNVQAGPPTLIDQVKLRLEGAGENLPEARRFLKQPALQVGQQLDHARYTEFKNEWLDTVYRAGYLDARYETARLAVTPAVARAVIDLQLVTGKRYYFGEISITQEILDERFVERFVQISPGEPFMPNRLVDLQLALAGSDYFSNVAVDVARDGVADQRIPVQVVAEANRARRYTASLGFGTDTGPRTNLGALFRRLNRRGHQASADVQLSGIKNTLGLEYGIPIQDVTADRLSFFASAGRGDVGDADTDQYQLGTRREDSWGIFRRDLYLLFSHENFSFGDLPQETATLLMPGMRLSYQQADNAIFTRRGFSVSLDIHGGLAGALSDTTFVHSTAKAQVVLPLASKARLLLRGQVGVVTAQDFNRLPPSERFFTGGDRSVRGYAFEALAPENEFGDETGGEFLSVLGVEADIAVYRNFYLAAFYDIGGAGDAFGDALNSSVGLGVRYRTPVGMVRLDLAHPLDDPDNSFRIHVTFGPDL